MLFKLDMGTEKDSLYFDAKGSVEAKGLVEDYYRRSARPGQPAKRGKIVQVPLTNMSKEASNSEYDFR